MESVKQLEVYHAGDLTVLGFGGRDVLDNLNLAECRDELTEMIREHHCRVIAFDLTGVKIVPSGMLGLLASLHRSGVDVQVFNACEDIREVLEITKLDRVIEVCEVQV